MCSQGTLFSIIPYQDTRSENIFFNPHIILSFTIVRKVAFPFVVNKCKLYNFAQCYSKDMCIAYLLQSVPGDMCDRTFTYPQTCKIPSTSEKSPMPTSLSTVQSHMPNRNFVVTTATLVTVTFCFHNSALSCFVLNQRFDMLQQHYYYYYY